MTEPDRPRQVGVQEDPLYRHSLREARFILGLWACCFFYTITYCYLNGYLVHPPLPSSTGPDVAQLAGPLESFNRPAQSVRYPLGLGIPDWVFYGVALPWVVCIVVSFWYCLFLYQEDDLGDDGEPEEGEAS